MSKYQPTEAQLAAEERSRRARELASIPSPGHSFRGRRMDWDPDQQAIEQERQRWVYEKLAPVNEAIVELAVDPERQYRAHRQAYEDTGDLRQLHLALEYVRPYAPA